MADVTEPRLSNQQVADAVDVVVRTALDVRTAVSAGVLERMTEARPGPGSGGNGRGGGGAAFSDPTAAAAMRRSVDHATRHRGEIEHQLRRALSALGQVRRLCEVYPPAAPADAAAVRRVAQENAVEPGCRSCERIGRWEPPDSRLAGPTDVGGRLSERIWLCVWCYERVRAWGRCPTVAELEAHHAGRRVPWPADVPQPKRRRSA